MILLAALAVLSAAEPSHAAPPAALPSVSAPSQPLFRNSVGFVQGYFGDAGPYWFLIDTGANRSAFDRGLAERLGLKKGESTEVAGTAGVIAADTAIIPALRLGGVTTHNLSPTLYDLSGSLAPEGAKIAGIVGHDVLGNLAILFDPAGGRLAMAPKAETLADLASATVVPMELDNGIPRIDADVNGRPMKLRIDSGASIGDGPKIFVNITERDFAALKGADAALVPYTHFTATGTGGTVRIPVIAGKSLKIGDRRFADPHLIVQPPTGYFASPDAVGFLGLYALKSKSGVIVDYPGKRLLILP